MTAEVGSVAFMAPELLKNLEFDSNGEFNGIGGPTLQHITIQYAFSIDIFSYGVILWEIITRDQIFNQYKSVDDIKKNVLNGIHPKIPNYCPKEFKKLIQRCWDNSPINRPPFSYIKERLKRMMQLHQQTAKNIKNIKNNKNNKNNKNSIISITNKQLRDFDHDIKSINEINDEKEIMKERNYSNYNRNGNDKNGINVNERKHTSKKSWIKRAFSTNSENDGNIDESQDTKVLWLPNKARTVSYKVTSDTQTPTT